MEIDSRKWNNDIEKSGEACGEAFERNADQ